MKENEITLVAVGPGRSGKTYLLRKIEEYLKFGGYDAEFQGGIICKDGTIPVPFGHNAEPMKINRYKEGKE